MNIDLVTLEDTRFRECVRPNDGGSRFLGYLYGKIVVRDVFDVGEHLMIGLPDIKVRITVEGKPRIDFPSTVRTDADGNVVMKDGIAVRDEHYFSANAVTRSALTVLVFQLPAVQRAVEVASRLAA